MVQLEPDARTSSRVDVRPRCDASAHLLPRGLEARSVRAVVGRRLARPASGAAHEPARAACPWDPAPRESLLSRARHAVGEARRLVQRVFQDAWEGRGPLADALRDLHSQLRLRRVRLLPAQLQRPGARDGGPSPRLQRLWHSRLELDRDGSHRRAYSTRHRLMERLQHQLGQGYVDQCGIRRLPDECHHLLHHGARAAPQPAHCDDGRNV